MLEDIQDAGAVPASSTKGAFMAKIEKIHCLSRKWEKALKKRFKKKVRQKAKASLKGLK